MNKRQILYFIATLLVVVVLVVFLKPGMLISPGELISGHSEFADDCFACHSPLRGSTAEKCIACHKIDEIGIKTTKGKDITGEKKNVAFHQELTVEECVSCHSDHKGVMKFRPANQFSHDLLQVATRKQCNNCHENPGDTLHRKIKGNCGQCHNQDAWTPATFKHDKYFVLDRDHDVDCATCHVSNNYTRYTCYGCHEHSRAGVRREHREEGIRDFENCTECHLSADEDEAERIWKRKRRLEGRYRDKNKNDDD